MSEKKQIKISDVLQMLEDGKNRQEIGKELGIVPREVKMLFEHPKLKGKKRKVIFVPSFEVADDTDGADAQAEADPDSDSVADKFE